MELYLFYIFSFITVLSTILMIFQKNPLSSAFCLILSFFSLAALFVLLDAHFVAALEVLIYAGAIMVLFLFVIMLLNLAKSSPRLSYFKFKHLFVVIIGLSLFVFFALEFLMLPQVAFPEIALTFGTAEKVGELLFSKYIIPFELMGLILLVGIVGAILLGRKEQ